MAKKIYTLAERKAQFVKEGLVLAKRGGITKVSAAAVARKCKVSAPMVFNVFGNRAALRKAVDKEAKAQGVVIAADTRKAIVTRKAAPKAVKKAVRPKAVAKAPRKRSVKDKAAGKRKVSRSAKDGKFVDKTTVKKNPATTVTQTVKAPRVRKPQPKYQPAAAPTNVNPNPEPKATLA